MISRILVLKFSVCVEYFKKSYDSILILGLGFIVLMILLCYNGTVKNNKF